MEQNAQAKMTTSTLGKIAAGFQRDGFLILRQAYTGEQLALLREKANTIRAYAESHDIPGRRFWYNMRSCGKNSLPEDTKHADYSWGVNEITRRELFDPALINALAAPRIDGVINALLEEPRAWGLKILWAPRRSHYNLHWHRDCSEQYDAIMHLKPSKNDHIQFNAALEYDDSFIVAPGSHRRAKTIDEVAAIRSNKVCELPGQIRAALEPGDMVIMDAHAVHRGEAQAGAPRLSLHFSCQAQWVPLREWGSPEEFAFICSDTFIEQLDPQVRPYYQRLQTAARCEDKDPNTWLVEHARSQGWTADLVDPVSNPSYVA